MLSVPILGFLYGPVAHIPCAAFFTRWVAMPVVLLSGFWLWLKPKVLARINARRAPHAAPGATKNLEILRYGTK